MEKVLSIKPCITKDTLSLMILCPSPGQQPERFIFQAETSDNPVMLHRVHYLLPFGSRLALLFFAAAEPSLANECAELKTPEQYCNDYKETKSLENYEPLRAAHQKCVNFYTKVVESTQIVCEYNSDPRVQEISDRLANAANAGEAAGSQANVVTLSQESREVILSYDRRALFALNDSADGKGLIGTFQESKKALEPLLKESGQILREEIHCQKSGRAGAPPSFLLAGVTTRALDEQTQTHRNMNLMLRVFQDHLREVLRGVSRVENMAKRRLKGIGEAARDIEVSPPEPDAAAPAVAATRAGAQRYLLRVPSDAVGQVAQRTAERLTPRLGGVIAQEVVRRGGKMVFGATVSSLSKLVFGGEFDALSLSTLGLSLTAGAVGLTFGPATLLAISSAAVEAYIRQAWQAEENRVAKPFLEFARPYARSNPSATSEQVAQAYAAQKQNSEFCGRCGRVNSGSTPGVPACPARNRFNDNWFDETSAFGTYTREGERVPGATAN